MKERRHTRIREQARRLTLLTQFGRNMIGEFLNAYLILFNEQAYIILR